jgi:dihydropteroate synthase
VAVWRLGGGLELDFPPPLTAGIVNVTTDSFYSGSRSGTPERAIADGMELAEAGFGMLDVGALAARSGPPVSPQAEVEKLVPAIKGLAARSGVPVAADTFSAEVARQALAAGAVAVNDISGGVDPEMFDVIADAGCGYVLMHIEGPPRVDRASPPYDDVVEHLKRWFSARIEALIAAGVDERAIALDPGPDFDLTVDDDIEILRRLGELADLGRPIYAALSRKDFLGAILVGSWEGRVASEERGPASYAVAALAVAAGASILRVHDLDSLDAITIASAIEHGRDPGAGVASA